MREKNVKSVYKLQGLYQVDCIFFFFYYSGGVAFSQGASYIEPGNGPCSHEHGDNKST